MRDRGKKVRRSHYSETVTCRSVTLAWLRVATVDAFNTVRVCCHVCCLRIGRELILIFF